jgi:hypothetical protein
MLLKDMLKLVQKEAAQDEAIYDKMPTLAQVKLQFIQCRNDIECVVHEDEKGLHLVRHDQELQASKVIAAEIVGTLKAFAETDPQWAQEKGCALQEAQNSFVKGHIVEEDQLLVIAEALDFTLAVHLHFDLKEASPMYVNPNAEKKMEMVFHKTENAEAGHWSLVRIVPAVHLAALCSSCREAVSREPL